MLEPGHLFRHGLVLILFERNIPTVIITAPSIALGWLDPILGT